MRYIVLLIIFTNCITSQAMLLNNNLYHQTQNIKNQHYQKLRYSSKRDTYPIHKSQLLTKIDTNINNKKTNTIKTAFNKRHLSFAYLYNMINQEKKIMIEYINSHNNSQLVPFYCLRERYIYTLPYQSLDKRQYYNNIVLELTNFFISNNQDYIKLLWPVKTRTISSVWGPRMRTNITWFKKHSHRLKQPKFKIIMQHFIDSHNGIDLSAQKGDNIYAAMKGRVICSGREKYYGNFITIDHGYGIVTLYGHCNKNLVVSGESVNQGQKIAEVGCTGNATGPHLHFELRLNGGVYNPLPYMTAL